MIALLAVLGFAAASIPSTAVYLLWCEWRYPHDGQIGLGVIMIAPTAGFVGAAVSGLFTADLLRKKRSDHPSSATRVHETLKTQ